MILEILHDPQYLIPWEPWLLYSKVIQDDSASETLSHGKTFQAVLRFGTQKRREAAHFDPQDFCRQPFQNPFRAQTSEISRIQIRGKLDSKAKWSRPFFETLRILADIIRAKEVVQHTPGL